MPLDLAELAALSQEELLKRAQADPEWLNATISDVVASIQQDQQRTALAYHQCANPMATGVHRSVAKEQCLVGGNRSGKTDEMLTEFAIQTTGHIPLSLMATYPREKIRAPIRARLVCNSLTDTLEPIIKPKLRWDQWNGVGDPVAGRGHWGWIPQHCLVGGSWESAYSEKYRTLKVAVDNYWRGSSGEMNSTRGYSTIQMLSYDQDLSAFSGSSLHLVGHDELPPADIYRENRMRTLDVRGRIMTAFTPPDEVGASRADVTWFYDQVYQRGLPGPQRDPDIETFHLWTEKNAILSPQDIQSLMAKMTEAQRRVRLYGEFIHLSGVIYALFSNREQWWCFKCQGRILPIGDHCGKCQSTDLVEFCHVVEPHPVPPSWPVVFVIDPHPRKKDAIGWFAVTPSDDIVMIGELETEGTAAEVWRDVQGWEEVHRVRPVRRLMDPNMASQGNDRLERGLTMRQAFDRAGLRCDMAPDQIDVGIERVQELLKPDPHTHRPRLQVFNTCERFIYGMQRWSFDEWSRQGDREQKEKVRDVQKDYPDLIRYLALTDPTFDGLRMANTHHHSTRGRSRSGY